MLIPQNEKAPYSQPERSRSQIVSIIIQHHLQWKAYWPVHTFGDKEKYKEKVHNRSHSKIVA